jgi:hypothetical protein
VRSSEGLCWGRFRRRRCSIGVAARVFIVLLVGFESVRFSEERELDDEGEEECGLRGLGWRSWCGGGGC